MLKILNKFEEEKMKIEEIKIKEFEDKIYKEYVKLFPEEEQREWEKIQIAYENGIEKFYKITDNDSIIGFFMLEKINENFPYYLDYFGIFQKYQNKGYGTKSIQILLTEIIKNEDLYIEIEKEDERNFLTIKRAEFYKKLNFKRIESEYLLYNVLYVPFVYTLSSEINKEKVDRIMFEYYKMNCGEEEIKKNCKKVK